MKMPNKPSYLAVQMLLPEKYKDDQSFILDLKCIQELQLDGLELNIVDPGAVNPTELRSFLEDFELGLSMFATGATAKHRCLSLASTDDHERNRAVSATVEFLQFAAEFDAGIIAGFLKAPLKHSTKAHREALKSSIADLAPECLRLKTPMQIEAINRFESPLGHSLDDTYELISHCANEYTCILADTWHMNIEERNPAEAIVKHHKWFKSFHLSDSNRLFPGFGSVDFKNIMGALKACGYSGRYAIEGITRESVRDDLRLSVPYLRSIFDLINEES